MGKKRAALTKAWWTAADTCLTFSLSVAGAIQVGDYLCCVTWPLTMTCLSCLLSASLPQLAIFKKSCLSGRIWLTAFWPGNFGVKCVQTPVLSPLSHVHLGLKVKKETFIINTSNVGNASRQQILNYWWLNIFDKNSFLVFNSALS